MATLTPTAAHVEFAPFIEAGVFTVAEIHAAEVIVNTVFAAAQSSPQFLDYLSVAIAVWAPANGHVCADLSTIASRVTNEYRPDVDGSVATRAALQWPDTDSWVNHLSSSPLVGKPHLPDPSNRQYDVTHPLVLDGTRLYLTRQWIDECDVAAMLCHRSQFAREQRQVYQYIAFDASPQTKVWSSFSRLWSGISPRTRAGGV
jgi:hypothetical protein